MRGEPVEELASEFVPVRAAITRRGCPDVEALRRARFGFCSRSVTISSTENNKTERFATQANFCILSSPSLRHILPNSLKSYCSSTCPQMI
jgi:hypothetical protein